MQGEGRKDVSGGAIEYPLEAGWHRTDKDGRPILILRPGVGCAWDTISTTRESTAGRGDSEVSGEKRPNVHHSSGKAGTWRALRRALGLDMERALSEIFPACHAARGGSEEKSSSVVLIIDMTGIDGRSLRWTKIQFEHADPNPNPNPNPDEGGRFPLKTVAPFH